MESKRQKKVSNIVLEELAKIFQKKISLQTGALVTVSEVKVTSDLSIARVYLSVFPIKYREPILNEVLEQSPQIRKELGNSMAKIVRIIPELKFFTDTSLDQVEKIDRELKGKGDNPIL